MDLPEWLPSDLSNAKLETVGPRLKLRGHAPHPLIALEDYIDVLEHVDPPGFILSRASIEAEHPRCKRL